MTSRVTVADRVEQRHAQLAECLLPGAQGPGPRICLLT